MKVFISYKWEDEAHNAWVEQFATDLRAVGIEAFLDRWEVSLGDSFTDYMTSKIHEADAILFIMTPASVKAAEAPKGKGGAVKFEMQMATARRTSGDPMRLIGIYRKGDTTPAHLRDHRYADFRDDERYKEQLQSLADDLLGRMKPPPLVSDKTGPTLRFRDERWVDPVSLLMTVDMLQSGKTGVEILWPQSTQDLVAYNTAQKAELENYHEPTSRFAQLAPEWAVRRLSSTNEALEYVTRVQQNVLLRVLPLVQGMEKYWGGGSGFIREALGNFVALANAYMQLRLSEILPIVEWESVSPPHIKELFADGYSPSNSAISYGHATFKLVFTPSEPIYTAYVRHVSGFPCYDDICGPQSLVLEAYRSRGKRAHLRYESSNVQILNSWFREHVIPQLELKIAEKGESLDVVIDYSEEMHIVKVREKKYG